MEKENTGTSDQVTSEESGSIADRQLPLANCGFDLFKQPDHLLMKQKRDV